MNVNPAGITSRAVVAAWLAFIAALAIDWTLEGAAAFVISAAIGAALVVIGYVAASGRRVLPERSSKQHAQLALWSIAAGAVLGVINLVANWAITRPDPALRDALVTRMMAVPSVAAVVSAPITEEIVFRLFVMSLAVWVTYRVTKREQFAFVVGLVASALIFAAPHLVRPLPEHQALANYYRVALLAKYTVLGVPFGWIFWRWGLPFAILCHSAGNAIHLALQWKVF